MKAIENRLQNLDGGRILDVASAEGGFIDILVENLPRYKNIIGIDITDSKFNKARQKFEGRNITFAQMDGANLGFGDRDFNTVSICNSLHHLGSIPATLNEMYRVLRPGGAFIVVEMIHDNQSDLQLNHVNLHHWWAKIHRLDGITHNPTLARSQIIEQVERLGLKSPDIFEYNDPESDPEDTETLEYINNIIDEYILKLHEMTGYSNLIDEGGRLRRLINQIGIAWATELVIIGRK